MGIRYYAYTFEADQAELALAQPMTFMSDDPLADAWGMPHGARVALTDFQQSVPKTQMLYLDKAWGSLQGLCRENAPTGAPRACYRMFEGQVGMSRDGWRPWVRTLTPEEVVAVADDLVDLQREMADELGREGEDAYIRQYLDSAVEFVKHAAAHNRGFVYMIG